MGELLLRKPSSGSLANLKKGSENMTKVRRKQFVLNLTKFYFANLVRAVRRTTTTLFLRSKTLRSTCSGNHSSSKSNLASDWLKHDSFHADENFQLGQRNMDDGVNVFSRFGGNCLICGLAEGAALPVVPYLLVPADKDFLIMERMARPWCPLPRLSAADGR